MTAPLPPVMRDITVKSSLTRAFDAYTAEMGKWWPPAYRLGEADLADVVIEPKTGGRWYERGVDGSECDWGRVLAWDPPHRVALSWQITPDWRHVPDAGYGSEIEVRFTAVDAGTTRIDLTHGGFDGHGDGAQDMHDTINGGMALLVDRLREYLA